MWLCLNNGSKYGIIIEYYIKMLKWLENDSNGTIVPLVGHIFI